MATYVCLMNFTSDGVQGIKEHPKRRDEARKAAEGMGLQVTGVYMTLGPYDLTVILEAPNDEMAATFALGSSMRGKISTLTMRAFTESETDKLISGLP